MEAFQYRTIWVRVGAWANRGAVQERTVMNFTQEIRGKRAKKKKADPSAKPGSAFPKGRSWNSYPETWIGTSFISMSFSRISLKSTPSQAHMLRNE